MLKTEECALVTVQNSNAAAVKDVLIVQSMEECVFDMGLSNSNAAGKGAQIDP